jgi:hypothetical protein
MKLRLSVLKNLEFNVYESERCNKAVLSPEDMTFCSGAVKADSDTSRRARAARNLAETDDKSKTMAL